MAIPEGATARIKILESRTELLRDINIAPAPNIPLDTDIEPLKFEKDLDVYNTNAFYPVEPVIVSERMEIRGVDVVL